MTLKDESRVYFRALGKHIEVLRKQIGMTQAELARALGVSQQTVYALETGDRRVSVLILGKLSTVFETPVDALMGLRHAPLPAHRRLSPAGIRHAESYQRLGRTDQRFVKKIINVLQERNSAIHAGGCYDR